MTTTTNILSNTGTRAAGLLLFGSEMVTMIVEVRWIILFLLLLIIADFRFGMGESQKRYKAAKIRGDTARMEVYRWRTSRAIRRTCNKFVDYVMMMLLGMFFGMALLEPIGINHIFGSYSVAALAFFCESKSFFGHFFYLHGVKVESKSITGFFKAFAVALAKRKNEDVGEALDVAFNNDKEEEAQK